MCVKTDDMTNGAEEDQRLQLKIDAYGGMLFKLSYLRLQNVQDAEDVVQEVFYQYLKRSGPFESPEHEKAWFIKVTLNACRKAWRGFGRHPQKSLEEGKSGRPREEGEPETAVSGAAVSDPEEEALKGEERRRLMAAVMALPERYRDVIHLFYYEELSVKEIARLTGRGESTVTSQLTRGRNLLKKTLKGGYDFG